MGRFFVKRSLLALTICLLCSVVIIICYSALLLIFLLFFFIISCVFIIHRDKKFSLSVALLIANIFLHNLTKPCFIYQRHTTANETEVHLNLFDIKFECHRNELCPVTACMMFFLFALGGNVGKTTDSLSCLLWFCVQKSSVDISHNAIVDVRYHEMTF